MRTFRNSLADSVILERLRRLRRRARERRAARRMVGQFVAVRTRRESCIGILVMTRWLGITVVLSDGTLWSERWGEVVNVRPHSRPSYLRLVRAAGQVA